MFDYESENNIEENVTKDKKVIVSSGNEILMMNLMILSTLAAVLLSC